MKMKVHILFAKDGHDIHYIPLNFIPPQTVAAYPGNISNPDHWPGLRSATCLETQAKETIRAPRTLSFIYQTMESERI